MEPGLGSRELIIRDLESTQRNLGSLKEKREVLGLKINQDYYGLSYCIKEGKM